MCASFLSVEECIKFENLLRRGEKRILRVIKDAQGLSSLTNEMHHGDVHGEGTVASLG